MCKGRLILFMYLSTVFCTGSMAQTPVYFPEQLTTSEGLGSNKVNDIAQDDNGFLWIATSDGLNRFDGTEVIQYYHQAATNSLPHNYVYCLKKLPGNYIAIGTEAGLSFYNSSTRLFENFYFRQNDTLDEYNNSIIRLELDLAGNLWVGSKNCIYVFDKSRRLKKTIPSPFTEAEINQKRQKFIEKILPLSDGNTLLYLYNGWHICSAGTYTITPLKNSTHANRLKFLYDSCQGSPAKKNVQYFPASNLFKIFDRFFLYIRPCADSLFIMDEQGRKISSCSFAFNKYPYILWSQRVSILDSSRLLISFHNFGLAIVPVTWNNGGPAIHDPSSSLFESHEYGNALCDRQGNWWLATTEEGMQKISPRKQYFNQAINIVSPGSQQPIKYEVVFFTPYNNKLLIGTYGEGFFELDPLTGHQQQHDLTKLTKDPWANFTWNIRKVSTDSLWVGTQAGLFWYCISQKKYGRVPAMPGKPAVLDSVAVTTQFPDSHGLLWMGLGRGKGVCYFDTKNYRFNYYKGNSVSGYPLRYPLDIAEDKKNNLWFVSDASNALVYWERSNDRFRIVPLPSALQKQTGSLTTIYCGADSALWLGSLTDGLIKFNPATNAFAIYGHDRGLVNSHITSIYKDNKERLWLVTDGGLSCFDMSKETFANYTAKDGLPVQYPTSHFYYDPLQKRLYNGGKGLFFFFYPDSIYADQRSPKTIITAVLVNGKPFHYEDKLTRFGSKQNDITIKYTAVDLTDGPSTQYAYKLVGEDTAWIMLGNMRQINFSHLAPGEYTFLVRAANKDGVWSNETASMRFYIRAPFTKTAWFYGLLVLLMGSIFFIMYRFRLRQLKRTEQVRSEISKNLHDEVGSTLTNISLGSLLAKKQLKKAGDVDHILERIYQDSQHVSESMREIVWSINPNIDTIGEAFPRMLHYASELLEARNIELLAEIDPAIEQQKLSMHQRRDLYLIFKEAVNNLAKYSKATKVMIRFQLQGNTLVMIVSDNGTGFDTSITHDGDGLKNMRARAQTHHWKLTIESGPGAGTTITLKTQIA